MIDAKTLKKHNLKAVPFSCIREGQAFWPESTIDHFCGSHVQFARKIEDGFIVWDACDQKIWHPFRACDYPKDKPVCVPVWRVTPPL